MELNFHIEVNCQQNMQDGERICGDVFLTKKVHEEGRIIVVLSDGMGHGVKANILGTLTASMALNFTSEHKDISKISEIIMKTLPIDSEKKSSFATFSIIDIETDGKTSILEFENPQCFIIRGEKPFDPQWEFISIESKLKTSRKIRCCSFIAQKEDRIIIFSDGVSQSGLGSLVFPEGWGTTNMYNYILQQISKDREISASKLSYKVISEAYKNDGFSCKDDTSCAVVYFREPRKLLICTGPPFDLESDKELANTMKYFNGKKIICGATTGTIVARELGLTVVDGFEQEDPELPPISFMENVDLCTEGIITLSKVNKILRAYNNSYKLGKGPADQITRMLLESDDINFLVGTRINEAHQDPHIPVELEIRRTVVRRIEKILEEKFLKNVAVKFI